jgi:hypothetical protein
VEPPRAANVESTMTASPAPSQALRPRLLLCARAEASVRALLTAAQDDQQKPERPVDSALAPCLETAAVRRNACKCVPATFAAFATEILHRRRESHSRTDLSPQHSSSAGATTQPATAGAGSSYVSHWKLRGPTACHMGNNRERQHSSLAMARPMPAVGDRGVATDDHRPTPGVTRRKWV